MGEVHGFVLTMPGGIGALLLLALSVYAIVSIVGSGAAMITKVLWILIVLFMPLLGFIAWLLLGPGRNG